MDPFSMLGSVSSFLGGGMTGGLNASIPDQVTVSPAATVGSGPMIVGRENSWLTYGLLVLVLYLILRG